MTGWGRNHWRVQLTVLVAAVTAAASAQTTNYQYDSTGNLRKTTVSCDPGLTLCGGNCVPAPSAPTISTYAVDCSSRVTISWTSSLCATSYTLFRGYASAGPYAPVATTTATSYLDSGVQSGYIYYYVVTAANGAGSSAKSTQVTVNPYFLPSPPGGLSAVPGDHLVTLSWDGIGGASYVAAYSIVSNFEAYYELPVTTNTTATVSGLTNGEIYYFRVRVSSGCGGSVWSNQVAAYPAACGPANCSGCCSSAFDIATGNPPGTCIAGTAQHACGSSGVVCSDCGTDQCGNWYDNGNECP